jgi:hypothetical protein
MLSLKGCILTGAIEAFHRLSRWVKAVFAGMPGVTLFGPFLTPIFSMTVRNVVPCASRKTNGEAV